MENGKQGAFACVDSQKQYLQEGLTKREYFAIMIMQGMVSNPNYNSTNELAIEVAIGVADQMLKELDNGNAEQKDGH